MGIDELRDALKGLNAALEGQAVDDAAQTPQTLASTRTLEAETLRLLGPDGLEELMSLVKSHVEVITTEEIERIFNG